MRCNINRNHNFISNINIVAFDIISWIGLNEEVREYPVRTSLIDLREAPDPLTAKQVEGPARARAEWPFHSAELNVGNAAFAMQN